MNCASSRHNSAIVVVIVINIAIAFLNLINSVIALVLNFVIVVLGAPRSSTNKHHNPTSPP